MIEYSKRDFFYKDSVFKEWIMVCTKDGNAIATLTNSEFREESISITESLDSSEDLVFGRCEPSKLEFEVHNIIAPLKGATIVVDLILDHDVNNPFRVGTYVVDSDKPTANRDFRNVVCYDAAGKLGELEVNEWYDGLRFPMTLKAFRDSFFNHVGIAQETVTLINDGIQIQKGLNNPDDESSRSMQNSSISAMNVLNAICEMNGCFGHINRNNVFTYKYLIPIAKGLYPAEDLYPADDLYPSDDSVDGIFYPKYYESCEYEDFEVKAIDDVIIFSDDGEQKIRVNQNGANPYLLENNFLLYKLSDQVLQTVANNLYSKINAVIYSPCSIECLADLCIEVGDRYLFNDKYNQVYSYVMTRTMKGLQLLKDSLESRGNEDRTKNLNNLDKKISRAESKAESDAQSNRDDISKVSADLGTFKDLTADNFEATNAHIDTLDAREGNFETLTAQKFAADRADIQALYAADVTISGTLNASIARIGDLEADVGSFKTLTAQNFTAVNGEISNIKSTYVKTTTLDAQIANINTVLAKKATITELNASVASINNVLATKASITELNSDIATVNSLIATKADITELQATNATISQLNSEIVRTNEVLATKITASDVQTINLNADKITAGTIAADRLDGSVIAAKLAGSNIYCGLIAAGRCDIGGGNISGNTTCGGQAIATQDWVTANFVAK